MHLSDAPAWLRASDSAEYLPLSELLQGDGAPDRLMGWRAVRRGERFDSRFRPSRSAKTRWSVTSSPIRKKRSRRRGSRSSRAGHRVDQALSINHPAAPSKSRIAHLGNADLRSASRLVQVALRRDGWWNAERAWIQEGHWQFRELKDDVERERLAEEA